MVVVGAGSLGTAARLGLDASLGGEVVALTAVNVLGWFLLGLLSGRYGSRVSQLRLLMVVLGITAFTSLMSLVIDGITATGDVVVAFIEVLFGLMFGGIGHLITMPRGPDL